MGVGLTIRSALAASAIAAASSAKRGKKRRRRTLLMPCGGRRNGVDDAVGGTSDESCCAPGFGGTRDWSGLPDPAVHLILTALLPSLKDAFSLGSVCRAWRSIFAACKRDLFSALPPLLVDRGSSSRALGGFYALRERRFHRRKNNSVFFPWTYRRGRPIWATLDVIGVSHGYWIVLAASPSRNRPSPVFLVDPLSPELCIRLPQTPHKVICAVMSAPLASPDCVVVLMYRERILYCRPGDTRWMRHSFVEEGNGGDDVGRALRIPSIWLLPDQVAITGGKLYALHTNGKVVIVELFPRPTVTFLEVKHSWSCYRLPRWPKGFLMESNGEILHVAFVCEPPMQQQLGHGGDDDAPRPGAHKLIVRRLDLAAREWVTLSTLGDRCLFVKDGATCLTSAAPSRWGGEGDCIYTFCNCWPPLFVFHMKDGRTEHHPMPEDYQDYDWLIPSFCY